MSSAPHAPASSPSSVPPRPESPIWVSFWPSGWAARSSTPTPCSSTGDGHRYRQADARGARRGPAPPARRLGRHRDRLRRRVPADGPGADRRAARRRALARPGRRLRPVRPRGRRQSGVPRHRPGGAGAAGGGAGPARPRCAARPARRGRPRRPPARSCRATAAASSARWRSSRSPDGPSPPTSPATTRSTTRFRSASTWPAPNWTSASHAGSTGCGRPGSSKKCAHWRRRGCARGVRRRAPSATSRCSPHLLGACTEEEARAETVRATKRFARRQDSWFRRDPRVHWLSGAAADLRELPRLAMSLVERPVTA